MSQPTFPWKWVVFFLLTAVIGVVVYDVYTSKTVKGKTLLCINIALLLQCRLLHHAENQCSPHVGCIIISDFLNDFNFLCYRERIVFCFVWDTKH